MTIELTGRLDEVREHLSEARRYIRSNVAAAREYLAVAERGIGDLATSHGTDLTADLTRGQRETLRRLAANLAEAAACIQVCPDATVGYVDGCRHELAAMRSAMERGSES